MTAIGLSYQGSSSGGTLSPIKSMAVWRSPNNALLIWALAHGRKFRMSHIYHSELRQYAQMEDHIDRHPLEKRSSW